MLNILEFAGTQTEFRPNDEKPSAGPRATNKQQYRRRLSMKPYYFNEIGKICSNPLPSMVTASTSPESPLKYRTLGIKFDEIPDSPPLKQRRPIRSSLSPTTIKLQSSLNTKEIFVIENGQDITEKLIGFSYTMSRSTLTRKEKEIDKLKFLELCRIKLSKNKKFKFIFSVNGKLYNYLQEIPYSDKVIIVSYTPEFKGIKDTNTFQALVTTQQSKSVALQVEDRFSTKTAILYNNNYTKPELYMNKTASHFSNMSSRSPIALRTPRTRPRLTMNELKLRLGQTAVQIDTELPKLFDIGMEKIKQTCHFSESEIHKMYAKYKMLLHLSIAKNPNHDIRSGISREIFVESYYGSMELNFVLGRIFDCIDMDGGGTISWEEYLRAMDIMCNGTYEQQIDLFFRVYDYDGNGSLSFSEIRNLCKLQLQNSDADNIIEELATSFASLIFDITETRYEEEIPAHKIKEVLGKQTDKSLIEMFCSFSFMKN